MCLLAGEFFLDPLFQFIIGWTLGFWNFDV